ncbi:MAG: hypothetical protein Kapaf2KO_12490 [Candidatus Kapaibacteriales bacterium]
MGWDETQYFHPASTGTLEKVYIYLHGDQPASDTIRIVKDPTDGYLPTTWWVSSLVPYSSYVQIPINYNGTSGWYEFDVSQYNIEIGGLNRVGIQHLIKQNGPYFVFDDDGRRYNLGSWLVDVFTPNPNFFNIPGTIINQAGGDFLIRLKIAWDYDDENGQPSEYIFTEVTKEVGLLDNEGNTLSAVMMSVYDINNDGYEDVFTNNQFFINESGTLVDKSTDYSDIPNGRKTFADIDMDGNLDIMVTNGSAREYICFGNEDGGFEITQPNVMNKDEPLMTALLLDYNNDGLLDIYIARNRRTVSGQEVYYHDQLLKNMGDRTFEDVSIESGIRAGESTATDCYGANIVDFNGDNLLDIFVATYRLVPDLLYINNGDGTFEEVARMVNVHGVPTANPNLFGHGMGSDWADFDNDGDYDLAVGNLSHPDQRGAVANPSYILEKDGDLFKYRPEISPLFFEMNAAPHWFDYDNDGYKDLFSAQYAYYNKGDQNQPDKNSRLYKNNISEDGTFEDVSFESGIKVHGAWTGYSLDYDKDGDLDLLVASNKDEVKLYRNDSKSSGASVTINPYIAGQHNYGKTFELKTNENTYKAQLFGTHSAGRDGKLSDYIHFGIGEEMPESLGVTFPNGEYKEYPITEPGYYVLNDIISSVDDMESGVFLYPNPAKDILNISDLLIGKIGSTYSIYSTNGRIVQSGILNTNSIPVSGLVNGTYILELGETELKFVISK